MKKNKMLDGQMNLLAITWPIFIEILLQMLLGSVDTFMLSHISYKASAAVGVTQQIIQFSISLFSVFGLGVGIITSQMVGAKKYRKASQIAAESMTINLLFGLVVSFGVVWLSRPLFQSFYQLSPDLLNYTDQYMRIVGGSLFMEALIIAISPVIRSYGYTRDTMLISLGMNVLHVIGNVLLLYGWFGLPHLGVTGVAISTAASRLIALFAVIILLYRKIEAPIQLKDYLKLYGQDIRWILSIGLPSAGEWLSYQSSQMVTTRFVALMGTEALGLRRYIRIKSCSSSCYSETASAMEPKSSLDICSAPASGKKSITGF